MNSVAQSRLGLLDGGVGQACDEFQIDPAVTVEADAQRVVQTVGMGGHGRHGADGPLREAFRLAGEPSFFIRLLQRHDEVVAGFLAAVGALVGAVAQSSELAREPVVSRSSSARLASTSGSSTRAGSSSSRWSSRARSRRRIMPRRRRASSPWPWAISVTVVPSPYQTTPRWSTEYSNGATLVRPDRDLRPSGRFRLAQRQRRAVGDLWESSSWSRSPTCSASPWKTTSKSPPNRPN